MDGATEALLLVAERNGQTMLARIGMIRAQNRQAGDRAAEQARKNLSIGPLTGKDRAAHLRHLPTASASISHAPTI
ncbi:hypothetical protein [Bradyrhizobium sp. 1]|uniref:hypothetical protein n=1 Tax=Bradyrhizobium sp. 1 TaxID=241591 RepID=UPI001FF88CA9|nr:hypothetical protein [Bradyrhizobium sp. 1]